MSKVSAVRESYEGVTPYLIVNDAAAAMEFYKNAFNATELVRMDGPGGKIMHADMVIGKGHIMLADEFPEMGAVSPKSVGGSPVTLMFYVEDVDSLADQAVKAGATLTRPVADQFYGDRTAGLEDPFGHKWYVATQIEIVDEAEMKSRMAKSAECATT